MWHLIVKLCFVHLQWLTLTRRHRKPHYSYEASLQESRVTKRCALIFRTSPMSNLSWRPTAFDYSSKGDMEESKFLYNVSFGLMPHYFNPSIDILAGYLGISTIVGVFGVTSPSCRTFTASRARKGSRLSAALIFFPNGLTCLNVHCWNSRSVVIGELSGRVRRERRILSCLILSQMQLGWQV
jgi:hypothetical protein